MACAGSVDRLQWVEQSFYIGLVDLCFRLFGSIISVHFFTFEYLITIAKGSSIFDLYLVCLSLSKSNCNNLCTQFM